MIIFDPSGTIDIAKQLNQEVKQMNLSNHAQKRIPQRGLAESDIDLIVMHGTETRDGFYLRSQDAKVIEEKLRKQIKKINQLSGKYVVVKSDTVVTAYHPGKKKQKKILRN
jgi:hypothetical protein